MKRLFLMQGVPGSGKTTVAEALLTGSEYETAVRLSTDDSRVGECGHYVFDPKTNWEHHASTQRACADAMRKGVEMVVVDNTNITNRQARPYLALAGMYGYDVQVVRVDPGIEIALRRNATRPPGRAVPEEVVRRMHAEMERIEP